MDKPLVIRNAQLEALGPELERQFVERVVDWVRGQHRDLLASATREALEYRVRNCIDRARRYRFESKRDIARFVDMDLKLGHGFELIPEDRWMAEMLSRTELSPATRMYRIECRLERLAVVAAQADDEELHA